MLTEEAAARLAAQLGMENITASHKTLLQVSIKGKGDEDGQGVTTTATIIGGRQTSKNRSIKYICPVCGVIIRTTKMVNVVSGDCNVPFVRA